MFIHTYYMYIICKNIFDDIFKQARANFLHTFKLFHVLYKTI